jgi:hypothetical protein
VRYTIVQDCADHRQVFCLYASKKPAIFMDRACRPVAEKHIDQHRRVLPNLILKVLGKVHHELIQTWLKEERAEPPVFLGKLVGVSDQGLHYLNRRRHRPL